MKSRAAHPVMEAPSALHPASLFAGALPLLGLAGIGLCTIASPAHADDSISWSARPAVISWPNNHLAEFNVLRHYNSKSGALVSSEVDAYLGTTPKPGATDLRAGWSYQLQFPNPGANVQLAAMPPQVVVQSSNKTLIFVADNSQQSIHCYSVASSFDKQADGSKVPNGRQIIGGSGDGGSDTFAAINIPGGFDSFNIIALPEKDKTGGNFVDPAYGQLYLYPMLLTYVQHGGLYCKHLFLTYRDNQWMFLSPEDAAPNPPVLTLAAGETKHSACLVPARDDASIQAGFPYKLIVNTILAKDANSNSGNLWSFEIRLNTNFWLENPAQAQRTAVNLNNIFCNPNQDVVSFVGIDGRPAVNALDINNKPMHYVYNQDEKQRGYKWSWDGTYGSWWDGTVCFKTPVTYYFVSWLPGDTVTLSKDYQGNSYPAGAQKPLSTKVYRYALAPMPTYEFRAMSNWAFDAQRVPTAHFDHTVLRHPVIGIIEGPPPVPWQNLQLGQAAFNTDYASTSLTLAQEQTYSMSFQTSVGAVVKSSGSLGFAWDVSAEAAYQQFQTKSDTINTQLALSCGLQIENYSGLDIEHSISQTAAAYVLIADCTVYDYAVTYRSNGSQSGNPIPGSTVLEQAMIETPIVEERDFYMTGRNGLVFDHALRPGRLTTYDRRHDPLPLSHLPQYELAGSNSGNTLSCLTSSWSPTSSSSMSGQLISDSLSGNGVTFDVSAMIGYGTDAASVLAGVHTSGSWSWSVDANQSVYLVPKSDFTFHDNTTLGGMQSYGYNTYMLAGDQTYCTNLQTLLQNSLQDLTKLPYDTHHNELGANQSLLNEMSPASTPWLITYELDPNNWPVWTGMYDGTFSWQDLVNNDNR